MKNRLLSALTAGCVIFSAGAKEFLRYPAAELRELNGVRSWRIEETLQEEPCWITLSYDTGKNGSDRLARSLYLNGRLIPCSRASAYQYRGGRYFVTMQSDQPHRVRKDDVISLAEQQRGTVEALEIRKTPRKNLPLRLPSPKKNQLLQMESDRGSGLDAHRLRFRLRNLSGKARELSVRMRIMDYYGTPVAERTVSFRLEKEREILLPYRSGSSVQYRASVEVTEADGTSRSFGYSFLADGPEAPGGRHFRQHLNTGWEIAEIPDDGTLKTRTLQKSPPPGAVFRKTDLPCTWDTPIVFFRKQFRPVFAKEGKRFFLHVSRLALEADFYLNGSLVYRHGVQEAYAPFELEITDKLRRDGENTLLICARGRMAGSIQENLRKKSFNPEAEMRAMNHLMPGFSEIYLESTPEFSLNMPQIITDFTGKRISVKADLPKGFRLENRVYHREREVIPAFGESVRWENPILWGPDSFPLLRLESTVYAPDGTVADVRNTRFGFREIRAEGMNLLWNGKVVRFPGQAFQSTWNRSFMRPDRRDRVRARILELIAEGHRCLRHVYGDSHIADIADEEGILLTYGMAVPHGPARQKFTSDLFWENTRINNLQTIRYEFNHPSIFTWYTGNELFATSEDLHFRRTAPLASAVQKADPTRFTECGGDLDLHGLLKLISVHYPLQPLKAPDVYPPEMFYWRFFRDPFRPGDKVPKGMIRTTPLVRGRSPVEWGKKPIVVNETGWIQYYLPPHGMTAYVGDRIYENPEEVFATHTLLNRKMAEGQRDAGVSIITPWKVYRDESIREVVPPVSVVLLQQYNSFFTGREIFFDLNLFHDAMKKETLPFSWTLTRGETTVEEKRELLTCDYGVTFRRRIRLNLSTPGVYTLEVRFGEAEPVRKTLYFYDPIPLKSGLVVAADEEIRSRKESLLRKAEQGATVLILPRKDYPSFLPGCPQVTSRNASVNFTFHPDSPVFRGLRMEQLSFFYPDHRTGSGCFAKPHQGSFRSLLECGGPEGMNYSALLEVPYGKGRFLYSRLEFDFQKNPVACILYNNIMEYKTEERFAIAGVIGAAGKLDEFLKALNVAFEHTTLESAGAFSALIVDGSAAYTRAQRKILEEFPGKVLVLNPSAQFGITLNDRIPEALQGRAFRIAEDPRLAGITNGDLFWRRQKRIIHEGDVRDMYGKREFLAAPLGRQEITGGARILTCPGFFAVRGNLLFTTMDFPLDNPLVRDAGKRIFSELLTAMGVRINAALSWPSPEEMTFQPVEMDPLLDRTLTDDLPDDGKGGWTDQGKENDLRQFPYRKSGVYSFQGVPFRIRLPQACFMLDSLYRKGGKTECVVPVRAKADALYVLHTCAWTSRQHHYSIFVEYDDGSSQEIRMVGEQNLRDWRASNPEEPFHNVSDTFTDLAWKQDSAKEERPRSLYKTLWMNPFPERTIRNLRFRSRKKGVPLVFAVTRGFRKTEPKEPSRVKTTDPVLFQKLLAEAEKMEKSGNLTRAVQLYEKAIALNPEHPASYISLGLCYEKLERPEKAAEVYERSLRMNPNQPDVLQMLSNLKREEKRK